MSIKSDKSDIRCKKKKKKTSISHLQLSNIILLIKKFVILNDILNSKQSPLQYDF